MFDMIKRSPSARWHGFRLPSVSPANGLFDSLWKTWCTSCFPNTPLRDSGFQLLKANFTILFFFFLPHIFCCCLGTSPLDLTSWDLSPHLAKRRLQPFFFCSPESFLSFTLLLLISAFYKDVLLSDFVYLSAWKVHWQVHQKAFKL